VNSWKVILATMLIFGTGVITGGLLVRQSMLRETPSIQQTYPRPPQTFSPGGMRIDFLRRAQRELDLTPEQRAQVDEILKRSQERSRKLMEPVAPRLREEVQRTREEFREVLTEAQRKQFDDIWKHQQRPRDPRSGKERPGMRPPPVEEPGVP
jgi:Spy/CpxP family protein refolding chaperone